MKISYQWILAAIIILLIILVGAYALTNGNNVPATNVTATPMTTITLTPTPVAPSTTSTTVASVTPTAIVSSTPIPTPTLSGANGVKKTDFGYYITYPPFSDNQVHVNPNYVASQGNVVYFSPTSVTITKYVDLYGAVRTPDAVAVVHRSGDLSGTTHVTITADINDYIDSLMFSNTVDSSSADVTFGPGESQKIIGIFVTPEGMDSDVGQVHLTITDVDGIDSIGSSNQYTLNVNIQSANPSPSISPSDVTVHFQDTSATYYMGEGNMYDQHVDLVRTGDPTNYLTVNVILDQITEDVSLGYAVTFDAGSYTATYYYTVYGKGVDVQEPDVYTYHIEPDSAFTVVTPGTFTVDVTYYPPVPSEQPE